MAVGSKSYLELVKDAYEGSLQLPAFQRDWVWKAKQTAALFDSIRQKYPIGGFLFAEHGLGVDLQPRKFRYSSATAEQREPSNLVLDGQQRITAGIQLFYSTSKNAGDTMHFFIDINKVVEAFHAFGGDLEDDDSIKNFALQLDTDIKYIVGIKASMNPMSYLIDKHLLFTSLLRPDQEKHLDVAFEKYLETYSDKKKIIRNLIKPLFKVSDTPIVPFISLGSELNMEAISRIFSTLNTTGKLLTPFELIVAILYPKKIDLRDDILVGKAAYDPIYSNMDKTGEIALQVAVLLEGKDPKKSLLPKTLDKAIWEANSNKSFKLLARAGDALSTQLGFALDKTSDYIPYDSIFAPLAVIWDKTGLENFDQMAKASALNKIKKWVVGAALSNRYQEGVHNKQKQDSESVAQWIRLGDDYCPSWLKETTVPSLKRIDPNGALGKMIMCIINSNKIRDPLSSDTVELGAANCDDHHIFPTKYCNKLTGWNKSIDKSNVALNIMRLKRETNRRFSNDDPALQVRESFSARGENIARKIYNDQMIPDAAIDIILKENKTRDDFAEFISLREQCISEYISQSFGFNIGGGIVSEEEDEDGQEE